MALSRVVSEIFNIELYRDLEIPVKSKSRSLRVVSFDRLGIVSCWCSIVTLFLRYSTSKNAVTLKTGFDRAHIDFLLTFYSDHWPISYRFRDRRRFQSKNAKKISTPLYFAPQLKGYWNWVPALGARKLE